jgi:hypothetical protein
MMASELELHEAESEVEHLAEQCSILLQEAEHLKKRITSLETALRFRDDFIKNRGMWDEFVKRATEFARSLRMEAYESARRACDKPKPYSRNCVASEVPGATCLQPDCDCLNGHEEHERDGV